MITDDKERGLAYEPGANSLAKDGQSHVVVISASRSDHGCEFVIRDVVTASTSRIDMAGLSRKFSFAGYDPAYAIRIRVEERRRRPRLQIVR